MYGFKLKAFFGLEELWALRGCDMRDKGDGFMVLQVCPDPWGLWQAYGGFGIWALGLRLPTHDQGFCGC